MAALYHISPLIACIIVRFEGPVSDRDLIEEQRRMFSDPLFQGHYSRLVDATEVTDFSVSADTVRAVAKAAVERGLRKAALISNDTDLVYGLMRMYEAYAAPPAEVAVYHSTEEALVWLAESIET
jgi:stage II sporulation SpoAA-like protein